LLDGYKSSKNAEHLFIFIKEIYSTFEGFSLSANNDGCQDVSDRFSIFFDEQFDITNKEDIKPIPKTHKLKNALKAHRNVEAHSNYYCGKYANTRQTTWYNTLIEKLSGDENNRQKVINIQEDEWLIWNWNNNKKNNDQLEFCYIMKDKELQTLFHQLKIGYNKMIEKSMPGPKCLEIDPFSPMNQLCAILDFGNPFFCYHPFLHCIHNPPINLKVKTNKVVILLLFRYAYINQIIRQFTTCKCLA
jgi:hypothetical protein